MENEESKKSTKPYARTIFSMQIAFSLPPNAVVFALYRVHVVRFVVFVGQLWLRVQVDVSAGVSRSLEDV